VNDNDLRSQFLRAVPPVSDADTEVALALARRARVSRHHRRSVVVLLAPVLAAVATVTVVLAVIVGTRGSDSDRPAPAATGPSPVTAWFRHIARQSSTSTGVVDLSSIWILHMTSADAGTIEIRPSVPFGTGTFRRDSVGGLRSAGELWDVRVLDVYCGRSSGRYSLAHNGDALVFTVVRDACAPRREVLDGTVFAALISPDQLVG
jgi:hypothetical protein